MRKLSFFCTVGVALLTASIGLFFSNRTSAITTVNLSGCIYEVVNSELRQVDDCQPTSTIRFPNFATVYGNNHTISATGDFIGPIATNDGPFLYVTDLTITTLNVAGNCRTGTQALKGLLLRNIQEAAVTNLTVSNINKGTTSTCFEGVGFEVNNAFNVPRGQVTVEGIRVSNYQVTGLAVLNNAELRTIGGNCQIGSSSNQAVRFADSVQVAFGAFADIQNCHIGLNTNVSGQFGRNSTGVLLMNAAAGTTIRNNVMMEGNADIGISVAGEGLIVENNKVHETGPDRPTDIGILNSSPSNFIHNNKIRGFNIAVSGPEDGHNVAIPSPQEN